MKFIWPFSLLLFLSSARDPSVFTVYRSATTDTSWYTHLLNANAADKAGALSYLHTEVIPFNNRPPVCTRRWNYDIIAIYEVTVFNPSKFGGGNGPNIGIGFSAMDQGACTVPNCQQQFEDIGYFVGGQTQKGNCRAAYGDLNGSAYWYSFPAEGQCARPDGSKRCTYTARYVGKLKIDDLINSKGRQIEPNFKDWCMAMGWEFQNAGKDCTGSCKVQWAIDFWKAPCDPVVCQKRVDMLKDAVKSSLVNRTIPNGCDGATLKTFKYNSQCVRDCPSDTYLDWNYNCVPCNSSLHCASCNWATAPPSESYGQGGTKCLSCQPDFPVLTPEGLCLSSCPSGQYFAQDVKQCKPCSQSCTECSDSSTCIACPSTQWLLDGQCLGQCPPHFYGDNSNNQSVCLSCESACGVGGNCTSASVCTACGESLLLTPDSKCVSTCPNNTFLSNSTASCMSCHSTCLHCSGSGEADCTECVDPAFAFDGGRCVSSCSPQSFKNRQGRCALCSSVIPGCSKCSIVITNTHNATTNTSAPPTPLPPVAPTCFSCGSEPGLQYLHAGLCKTGCPPGFKPVPALPNTFDCVVAPPTLSPTKAPSKPDLDSLTGDANSSTDPVTIPVVISVVVVVVVVALAGIIFWRSRVIRRKKQNSVAQELYTQLR